MIILDLSNILIASLYADIGHDLSDVEINEDLLRHMILNKIRAINSKFRREYGEMVIACDQGSWRSGVFPYYKARRKQKKQDSTLDWPSIFKIFHKLRDDLQANFPYRVVTVQNAEADDVIGVLVRRFGATDDLGLCLGGGEKILIVSRDKDFAQLEVHSNVKRYDPIANGKGFMSHPAPENFLREHIIRGDDVDDVPNIMSDDDTFVVKEKRQKVMTAKRFINFMQEVPAEFMAGWERNALMIDLKNTPEDIEKAINDAYDAEGGKDRSKIFNYFVNNGLRNLLMHVGDF